MSLAAKFSEDEDGEGEKNEFVKEGDKEPGVRFLLLFLLQF